MAAESLTQPQSLEYHLVTLFEKLDELRRDQLSLRRSPRPPMQTEVRTLEFWRAIISECTSAFFYVLLVCGAASAGAVRATGVGVSGNTALAPPTATIAAALASGFAMAALTQCFGAHVNPALSIAAALARHISPMRGLMFVIAQCGGGIAGAALLFGVAVPGFQGNATSATALPARFLAPWERFGLEMVLSIVVILSYLINMDTYRKYLGSAALNIGAAYCACSLVMMPCLNPARALGPAFVLNMWENHWVYWVGPMLGGGVAALIYEFLYNPRRHNRLSTESIDGDSSSIQSEDDPYDDLDKPGGGSKFHGASSTYNTYRPQPTAAPNSPPGGYCASLTSASLYSAPPCKLERVESLYAGTKSLYAKSPPLTRANLNRSQSVYTKTQHQPIQPRAGPLVPAQSLYPMRFNSTTNPNAQNAQNAQQSLLRSDSVYGVRGAVNTRGEGGGVYGGATGGVCQPPPPSSSVTSGSSSQSHQPKFSRPESMYGMLSGRERNRQESAGDSTYGSYQSSRNYQSNENYQNQLKNQQQQQQQQQQSNSTSSSNGMKNSNTVQQPPIRQQDQQQPPQQPQPPPPLYAPRGQHSIINTANSVASYHHSKQHSPNPQY